MNNEIELSRKQLEYINNANHRWNGKVGATQCGKTYVDTLFVIPDRIIERIGKKGLNFIVGVSKETITRNIIEPLQEIYGNKAITDINSKNVSTMFGERVYCLGADNVGRVAKFRGARVKYLYIDEVYDINKEVFELLKSRLSFEYSMCDFAGNPQSPSHYVEEFINSNIDIYLQRYTIFDNPFLPKIYVDNLCKEYEGTVYYNRYILGQACSAEGLIYTRFANEPLKYKWTGKKEDGTYNLPSGTTIIGIDYGGTKSGQAFVCTRISSDYRTIITLGSEKHMGDIDPDDLEELEIQFAKKMMFKYNCDIDYMLPDNEEVVLIRGLKRRVQEEGWNTIVRGCVKEPINDRIDCGRTMISYGILYYIEEECKTFVDALSSALWDDNAKEDTRLDDFTTDIDTVDAWEYSWCRFIRQINDMINRRRLED
jgi:PBSX family phage terminase large subunit